MSGRKDVLTPHQIFDDSAMQSSLASVPTSIQYLDNTSLQLIWTGNGTGTFYVQGSLDYNPRDLSGTWNSLSLTPVPQALGVSDSALIDLNQLSFPWIRAIYTSTFVSGAITTVADTAGSLNSTYFLLNAVDVYYYIWFNINSAGVDPALPGKTGIQITAATNASANTLAGLINTALGLLSTLERVTASTNHVYFNIIKTGGSAGAGTSGFTVSNTDSTGILDGYISAKMV